MLRHYRLPSILTINTVTNNTNIITTNNNNNGPTMVPTINHHTISSITIQYTTSLQYANNINIIIINTNSLFHNSHTVRQYQCQQIQHNTSINTVSSLQ